MEQEAPEKKETSLLGKLRRQLKADISWNKNIHLSKEDTSLEMVAIFQMRKSQQTLQGIYIYVCVCVQENVAKSKKQIPRNQP